MLVVVLTAVVSPALILGAEFQSRAFQMRDDFGVEPLTGCVLQYYYYIPCPTFSWFWAWTGPDLGEAMGVFFEIGGLSTGGFAPCDPAQCHSIEAIWILDFAGYGTLYPGLFSVVFDAFCSDQYGCPVGSELWSSVPWDTHLGWNYVPVEPPLCVTSCVTLPGPPPSAPRILITGTHTGTDGIYPAWGSDNISTAIAEACAMHDVGCLPALYPRPAASHYGTIHTGFYGINYGGGNFDYCPPLWLPDGRDTTPDGSQYGFIELAWRIDVSCTGPSKAEAVNWSTIKAFYR
jgi:hypothetical protein